MREAKQNAQLTNKAKNEFLANISHELRSPLNGIFSASELLRMTTNNLKQTKYIDILDASGSCLLELIQGILDLTKLESGEYPLNFEKVNLLEIIESEIDRIRNKAEEKGIQVSFEAKVLPEPVIGDAACLSKIIRQILMNGIKFTEEGHVAVCLKKYEPLDSQVKVEMTFEDTGIGIPEEKQENLFPPFVQADSSKTKRYEGTGHGLRLAKKLVGLMNGTIRVESQAGTGSKFYVELILEQAPKKEFGHAKR